MTAQQLKNSILQLAVQGKLVPQDPNDEPASVLLERIRAEKEELIKAKKIKREKNPSVIFRGADNTPYEKIGNEVVPLDVPFEIPDSWEWVRLGDICTIARGGSPRPIQQYLTTDPNGINWIKIGDSDKGGKYINSTKERIIPAGVSKSRMVYAGDFLLTNSMSFGRPYILNVDGCIHDGWLVLSDYKSAFDRDYLYHMLSSSFAYYQFCDVVSGAVVKNLNSDKVAAALFPLPPLAEQRRIVLAIEGIEPYVSLYAKSETELSSLNSSFPDKLKKSILQWAVQGKLVPQDENDEPAEMLLERIRVEKEALIKAGKIKRDKHESVIFRRDNSHYEKRGSEVVCIDDELPFEIPASWRWVRAQTISTKEIKRGKSPQYTENSTVYVFAQKCNVKAGGINMRLAKFLDVSAFCRYPMEEQMIDGDIIVNSTGEGTLGRIGIFRDSDRLNDYPIVPDSHVAIIRTSREFAENYIYYVFRYYQAYLESLGEGSTKQTELKPAVLAELFVPIPPLEEQHRIVESLDKILSVSEQL